MRVIAAKNWVLFCALGILQFTENIRSDFLTFDEVSPVEYVIIENGYGGLQWTNFFVQNGLNSTAYGSGIVSPPNVAFNGGGNAAFISKSNLFSFGSAYLKAVGVSGTQVRVQGFTGTTQTYDNTYAVNGNAPNLIHFNYVGVDQVQFTASPFGLFSMDNLSLTVSDTNTLCTFALASADSHHGPGPGGGSVNVFAQSGCEWNVTNTNSWILITSSLTNTDNGSVTYIVATNVTGVPRNGFLNIAGQTFEVSQYGAGGTNRVDLGRVQTATIGHSFYKPFFPPSSPIRQVYDFLVDQDQSSGGGGVLSNFSANFDDANQFELTFSAPPGKRFLVHPPAGQAVHFSGALKWQSPNPLSKGPSVFGTLVVGFSDLEGTPPDFSASRTVLSELHGFIGFHDIRSTDFSTDLAFSSIKLTATVPAMNVGSGTLNYSPELDSALLLTYSTSQTNDPGTFISLVSAPRPEVYLVLQPNGHVTITFTGILQYATEANGTFEDVPGYPQGTYTIPKLALATHQYFRARGN